MYVSETDQIQNVKQTLNLPTNLGNFVLPTNLGNFVRGARIPKFRKIYSFWGPWPHTPILLSITTNFIFMGATGRSCEATPQIVLWVTEYSLYKHWPLPCEHTYRSGNKHCDGNVLTSSFPRSSGPWTRYPYTLFCLPYASLGLTVNTLMRSCACSMALRFLVVK